MDRRIKKLFERYESGSATGQERNLVEHWFNSFENEPQANIGHDEKKRIFDELDDNLSKIINKNHNSFRLSRGWMQVAALLVAMISVSVIFIFARHRLTTITYKDEVAAKGVKKDFTLPDGSIISLNSNSVIRIPSNFGEQKREIFLNGEAFFQVKHDDTKPFVIHSGNLQVTDLGTSFDVKAYPNETNIKIAVTTGSVSVERYDSANRAEMFAKKMIKNQQLVYDKLLGDHAITEVNSEAVSAWRYNVLRFDNASFTEIAKTLDRWYNMPIVLNNKVGNCRRYTLSFQNESIEHVLNVLANLSDMSYEIKHGTIFINLKNCRKNVEKE